MGGTKSKETTLKISELNDFHNMTLFSNEILIKLHDYYKHFSSIQTDDGVIDFDEFCIIIKKNDRNLTKRIFDAIDVNSDGSINYREFIKFISVFINGNFDDQIVWSYKIFSNPETKTIEIETMKNLIKDIVMAEESLCKFFNNELIDMIVVETFKSICGQEENLQVINFELYKNMIIRYPSILSWLKVDLDIIKNIKLENKTVKKSCL